ncbi:ROK family protein [bacterium]|nr:ROK family protein [bacterium]
MTTYVGVDIGGTKIRLTKTNHPQHVGETIDIPTPASFVVARHHMEEIIDRWQIRAPFTAIGVTAPGPLDTKRGVMTKPTHIPWHNAAIIPWLHARYRVPATLVHDATAAGICEARMGSAKKYRFILYVTISTGIGSALILDGKALPSPHNPEGGRILLKTPTQRFEQIASGTAIRQRYGRIAGQIRSRRIWREISQDIALGLYDLIVSSDPEAVIIGGGVGVHYKRFIKDVRKIMRSYQPFYQLPPILQAKYTEHAPLLGALLVAADATLAED